MGFEFFAVVRNGQGSSINRMEMDNELREEMARTFTVPAGKWLEGTVQRTEFDEAYSLSDNELFEIKQFIMPEDLLNAMRFPGECGEFSVDTQGVANIKALIAVNIKGENITAVFKNVGKAKKLQPTRSLMLVSTGKGYAKLAAPGIVVDDRISAVYENGVLLFKSPASVKQVLSLKDYVKEANDLEIIAFLEARFEVNTEKVLEVADTWMRKRFSALMQSTLFEEKSALEIYDTAKSFSAEIPMELSKDRVKLVLPSGKQDIKMILKFLNEEYYKGVLTGKDYQTQSKRPLQNAENAGGNRTGKKALSFNSR